MRRAHGSGVVGVAVVEALGAHVPRQEARVRRQAGNADAHVSVDRDDLTVSIS